MVAKAFSTYDPESSGNALASSPGSEKRFWSCLYWPLRICRKVSAVQGFEVWPVSSSLGRGRGFFEIG